MALCSAALVVGVGTYWQSRLAPLRHLSVKMRPVPTVFVAGDYARAFSTNGFVHRLSSANLVTRGLLVNVTYNGHVQVRQFGSLQRNPTIQVVFADNHHPQKQARQLATVMHQLHTNYHVDQFNAVGHSSGGNIIFNYLTNRHKTSQPTIRRFVSIATTYPGIDARLKRLPANLPILNIAGQVWQTAGDGGVNLREVLAFSHLLEAHGWAPQTVVIHGGPLTAEHSMLHINPTVDLHLAKFLYQ